MENNYIYHRVWAETNLETVLENFKKIENCLNPGTKICVLLSADGFGCGAVPVAKHLRGYVDFFAVATAEEASNLINHNIGAPILILDHIRDEDIRYAVKNKIRLTVYSLEMAKKINEIADALVEDALVHIKIDTGMNRTGFDLSEETLKSIESISSMPNIHTEGIYSDLYGSAEESPDSASNQIKLFEEFCARLEETGARFKIKHISDSHAALRLPGSDLNMVRIGDALYGIDSSRFITDAGLSPVLSLCSHVTMIKKVNAGTTVGYGATYKAERDTVIATVSIGYGDGYPRALSNKGFVLIRGKRAPIIGRVCMDQIMADVTDIEGAAFDDEVVLIGSQGGERISAGELASLAETCADEIVCGIGKRVPRIFMNGTEEEGVKDYFYDKYVMKTSLNLKDILSRARAKAGK